MYDYDILTGLALSPNATYGYDSSITPQLQALFNNTFNYIESRTYLDFQQVDYNTAEIKISIDFNTPYLGYAYFPGDRPINSDIFLSDELLYVENQYLQQYVISHEVVHAIGLNHTVRQDSVVSEVIDLNSLNLFPTAFDLWAIETNYLISQI
ncbi:MAG: matrixin family metalloprotease [Okeania sp. SIO3B5]|uniref:matrixin family metalloprotease n=1 Tax=Okeania sp. SIO3B5 TaxID=2607811 RepID=UPI0013FF6430|nr:matrixin family metalloprotease [Okeania sp. SIO3B5]NEO52218.1 matrixin family metalloprotease [Okeania sp. SIO3B5]